jgi:ribonuclease HII
VKTEAQQRALEQIESSASAHVIGIDEVGMGCWAGPVVVAGVVLPKGWAHKDVKDSKKLSPKRREKAWQLLHEVVLTKVVLWASNEEVDRHGVRQVREWLTEGAALYCMRRFPEALIVQDGDVPAMVGGAPQNMVWLAKADVYVPAVSAASIIAKVSRDYYMHQAHVQYPYYGWNTNVGYGTELHSAGLLGHGACPLHRRSYKPVQRLSRKYEDARLVACQTRHNGTLGSTS